MESGEIKADVAVVGAGVIGVCVALELSSRGYEVVLLDRRGPAAGCSYGNAGFICPSHVVPLAAPGVIAKVLKWMGRPDSPFYLSPARVPAMAGWLLSFARHCNPEHVRHSMRPLADLLMRSRALYDAFDEKVGGFGYERRGILKVFKTEKGFDEGRAEAAMVRETGQPTLEVDRVGLERLVPETPIEARGGILYPEDAHLDPAAFVRKAFSVLESRGVRTVNAVEVEGVRLAGGRAESLSARGVSVRAKQFVLAAGAWTVDLARRCGWRIALVPAKGYSLTRPAPVGAPALPLLLAEAKVAVTPMAGQLRYAGTLELAGFDERLDARRLGAIADAVPRYLPKLAPPQEAETEKWCGFRPCTPDGLPLIGLLPGVENLYIAAGHAMIGMAAGPGTGLLLAQLMAGKEPYTNTSAFDPARFCRRR